MDIKKINGEMIQNFQSWLEILFASDEIGCPSPLPLLLLALATLTPLPLLLHSTSSTCFMGILPETPYAQTSEKNICVCQ